MIKTAFVGTKEKWKKMEITYSLAFFKTFDVQYLASDTSVILSAVLSIISCAMLVLLREPDLPRFSTMDSFVLSASKSTSIDPLLGIISIAVTPWEVESFHCPFMGEQV